VTREPEIPPFSGTLSLEEQLAPIALAGSAAQRFEMKTLAVLEEFGVDERK
jgi:hypothetical protein